MAHFQCTPWAAYDGGDHVLLLARVESFGQQDDAQPLLFHRGQWGSIATDA
jgi:flavin reductase